MMLGAPGSLGAPSASFLGEDKMKKFTVANLCKKVLACALSATLAVCSVPAGALASQAIAEDEEQAAIGTVACEGGWVLIFEVDGGEATITGTDQWPAEQTDLTIPATVELDGATYPVTGIGEATFCGNTLLAAYTDAALVLGAVTLPNSVKYLEKRAFHMTSATSISIGTGIVYVEQYGISYNYSCTEISFADGAHPEYFGTYAFVRNTALVEFSIPALTGSDFKENWSYRIGDYCFNYCTSLETVIFEEGTEDRGSDYTWSWSGYSDASLFDGCSNVQRMLVALEDLTMQGLDRVSYSLYYAVFYYSSIEEAEADTAHLNYDKRVWVLRGSSLSKIALAEGDSIVYGSEGLVAISEYADEATYVWGYGDSMLTSGSNGGNGTGVRTLTGTCCTYPVARANMDYCYLSQDEAGSTTIYSGYGGSTYSSYKLRSDGTAQITGLTVRAVDGTVIDESLYTLVYTDSDGNELSGTEAISSEGAFAVYAQGVGEFADTATASVSFYMLEHTGTVTSGISEDASEAAAEATYAAAALLSDASFAVVAPESSWQACLVATSLAASGNGIAVFSDGTDELDRAFQSIVRAKVDRITFVGSASEIGSDAIERAKIIVNDDDGAYNYFDISDPETLALSVYTSVAKYGATSEYPHEWGDTAVLVDGSTSAYSASIAQYIYSAQAPVFFTAQDGTISSGTLEALASFSKIVVVGGSNVVSALAQSSSFANADTQIVNVGSDATELEMSQATAALTAAEFGTSAGDIVLADASDPAVVYGAAQYAALSGGTLYAVASAAEFKAFQAELEAMDADDVDSIAVFGCFTYMSDVAARVNLWNGLSYSTALEVGDTLDCGGVIYALSGASTVKLQGIHNEALSAVSVSTVTFEGASYTVTSVAASAFAGNTTLASVSLPKVTSVPAKAFKGCTALKSASFGAATSIGASAFQGCTKLTSISCGSVKTIGASAFQGCTALKKFNCTSKVLTSIGASAFAGCKKLATANFASTKLTTIGKQAFKGCAALKTLTLKTTKLKAAKIGAKAFSGTSKKLTVKVPKKKVKSYAKILAKKGLHKKAKVKA